MGDNVRYPAKLAEEIRRLEEAGLHFSPELLVSAMDPTEGSDSSNEYQVDSVTAVEGYSIGSRGVLISASEVEAVAQELRQQTATPPRTADAKAKLLELWIAAEPCLSESELEEMRPVVLTQLFGDHEEQVTLSRNSSGAQGGGY